ncbi:MAG: phosphotransferase [Bacteroidota bacterium]
MTAQQSQTNQQKEKYLISNPTGFFLDINDIAGLSQYLAQLDFLADNEELLKLEKPGEGNMNLVIRVITSHRSFIIKQSRPWVEKYPTIAAPSSRAQIEGLFYHTVSGIAPIQKRIPSLLASDPNSNILILEDLGATSDFTHLYNKGIDLKADQADLLTDFLLQLHQQVNKETTDKVITNLEMRKLNHEHIFHFPFLIDNGLDLDQFIPGLQAATSDLLADGKLAERAEEIGKHYLADGNTLLHGDYYPGSWLNSEQTLYIIDPEFCFFGFKEFDLAVFLAHLILSNQPSSLIKRVIERYENQMTIDISLVNAFVGTEILRRLIGVAQLPLELDLKEKTDLMNTGRDLMLSSKTNVLNL